MNSSVWSILFFLLALSFQGCGTIENPIPSPSHGHSILKSQSGSFKKSESVDKVSSPSSASSKTPDAASSVDVPVPAEDKSVAVVDSSLTDGDSHLRERIQYMDLERIEHELAVSLPRNKDLGNGVGITDLEPPSGSNIMTPPPKKNKWVALFEQTFLTFFNMMLWACVAAEVILIFAFESDEIVTPIILSFVIVSSSILQWWTEQQAENMMESLTSLTAGSQVNVIRGTKMMEISSDDLMPGDIIELQSGDKIPADIRILDACKLVVSTEALTGESKPLERVAATTTEKVSDYLHANNILWSGTMITKGSMQGVVFAAGDDTYLARMAASLNKARSKSTLEMQIEHFVHVIAVVALAVGAITLVSNILSPLKRDVETILRSTATAFFAQVPEGLLPTVTISLMIAGDRMAKQKVLIRKIDAIETLGSINVLCSDKTGTLTYGADRMKVAKVIVPAGPGSAEVVDVAMPENVVSSPALTELMQSVSLNLLVKQVNGNWEGSSITEDGLARWVDAGMTEKLLDYQSKYSATDKIPFDSELKWQATMHKIAEGDYKIVVKGAPEVLQKFYKDQSMVDASRAVGVKLQQDGLRVLDVLTMRVAAPKFPLDAAGKEDFTGLMDYAGSVGLMDPPRDSVPGAVKKLTEAGVRTIMITGDNVVTGEAIALQTHILEAGLEGEAKEYSVMSKAMLDEAISKSGIARDDPSFFETEFWGKVVKHTRVFARVSPEDKETIVEAFQHHGNVVAMTGDGVNDAPALKTSDVGIAMGIRGTGVAKDAADIILLEDEFASIVDGIEEGRLTSENLRKSIMYTLCSKIPQVVPTILELFGFASAMTSSQVLLLDIGTDIWTAMAYAWQPKESNLMTMAPRHPIRDPLVNKSMLLYSYGYMGTMQTLSCVAALFSFTEFKKTQGLVYENLPSLSSPAEPEAENLMTQERYDKIAAESQSMYYWTLVMGQIAASLATTTSSMSLFSYGLKNMVLNGFIVAEVALSALVLWKPSMQTIFNTAALPFKALATSAGATLTTIVGVEELRKATVRSKLAAPKP